MNVDKLSAGQVMKGNGWVSKAKQTTSHSDNFLTDISE